MKNDWNKIAPEVKHHVQNQVVTQLASPIEMIRHTTGSIITTIFAKTHSAGWPQVIPAISAALSNSDQSVVDGAFSTLEKICEDHSRVLEEDEIHRPLAVLVPQLIATLQHTSEKIRVYALSCILYFLPDRPPALLVHVDQLLQVCFTLHLSAPNPSLTKF